MIRQTYQRIISISTLTLSLCLCGAANAAPPEKPKPKPPIVLQDQGAFFVGGTVVTNPGTFDPIDSTPDGQTIHGDHAYVQYQIPTNARNLPLVMWHGGGQMGKTWESTPDGRDGFQNIFIREGWKTFILDQPRRGRASRSVTPVTINPVPGSGVVGEQGIFVRFRIGLWPDYFPGVSFSHDPEALNQWWRQQVPTTGTGGGNAVTVDATSALFDKIGPGVLLTHSASGILGWLTRIQNDNVKAIVSYEPVGCAFPEGEVPPPVSTTAGPVSGTAVSAADFAKLTAIPIQIVYGDNIPSSMNEVPNLDIWRGRMIMCQLMVDTLKAHGGDAELVHLPDVGLTGNTHFPMSDLNNAQVAGLLSQWLREKGLDKRGQGNN
jgi:hypothetical protein